MMQMNSSLLPLDDFKALSSGWADPQRPFVTLTYAQSLDGSIAQRDNTPIAISGEESLQMTHQLRANHDAILVGSGTVLADDPCLTTREAEGDDPQPVILDARLRFPLDARMLTNDKRPWIIAAEPVNDEKMTALVDNGAQVEIVPRNAQGRIDLLAALACIAGQGVGSVMVEGGAQVLTSFIRQQLFDLLVVTIAPTYIGGKNVIANQIEKDLDQADIKYAQFGRDLVMWCSVQRD